MSESCTIFFERDITVAFSSERSLGEGKISDRRIPFPHIHVTCKLSIITFD